MLQPRAAKSAPNVFDVLEIKGRTAAGSIEGAAPAKSAREALKKG
jgi:hypothetical protein